MKGDVKNMDDIKLKYILGNDTMELAEQLGSNLFDAWVVSQIDKMDDLLDKNVSELNTNETLKNIVIEKYQEYIKQWMLK